MRLPKYSTGPLLAIAVGAIALIFVYVAGAAVVAVDSLPNSFPTCLIGGSVVPCE